MQLEAWLTRPESWPVPHSERNRSGKPGQHGGGGVGVRSWRERQTWQAGPVHPTSKMETARQQSVLQSGPALRVARDRKEAVGRGGAGGGEPLPQGDSIWGREEALGPALRDCSEQLSKDQPTKESKDGLSKGWKFPDTHHHSGGAQRLLRDGARATERLKWEEKSGWPVASVRMISVQCWVDSRSQRTEE